ncbi:MAG: DUF29 domain-containing protein [Bryobacteraceae bacterium]|jgi:hypothetical protein
MQSQLDKTAADRSSLYDEDFFEWTRRNAELLRAGQLDQADIGHIAEEIEDMGRRDLKELNSRMRVLLLHLLKRQLQPEKRSRSWDSTIVSQRIEIEDDLKQSPSLRAKLRTEFKDNYEKAVRRAIVETGLTRDRFPNECPFTLEQILDPEFLP